MTEGKAVIWVAESLVNQENPWPGLASFTEDERAYFFGREEETAELLRRVRGRTLTVLFGQSGLGKTSLLNAGLSPRLREEDMIPIVVRLNHDPSSPALGEQVRKAIGQAISEQRLDGPMPQGETLWEYFHRKELELWTPRNRPATVVLIFDQFEEIYTLGRTNEQTRARGRAFLQELADLIENRPPASVRKASEGAEEALPPFDFSAGPCKTILSLREDYLPDLEGFRVLAPSIAENRQRLQLMTGAQALTVLCGPGGKLIDRATAVRVVQFVGGARKAAAGDEADLEGLRIEPALLSIFAQELNRKRQALGLPQITPDLLEGHRDQIISDFYERSLAGLPAAARVFIEDRLLTPSGYRDSLAMEIATGPEGVAQGVIDQLVGRRLLHIDQRLGSQRLELTHDVLTGPVRSSRDARQQGRAVEQARSREQAVRAQLGRARKRLMATSALAVLMLGLAIFSYFQWQEARLEKDRADKARQAAEDSAKLATSSIEHTLMEVDWPEAVTILSSMNQDSGERTADILNGLVAKYQSAGRRTEEIRVRLWRARNDPAGSRDWINANAPELTALLIGVLAKTDQSKWVMLEDFFAPAEAEMCAVIVGRLGELSIKSSAAEKLAMVSIGMHAREPIWHATGANPRSWTLANADAMERMMLDTADVQDEIGGRPITGFFEPARAEIVDRIANEIGKLKDNESVDPRRFKAALAFGGDPVQRALDQYQNQANTPAEDPKDMLVRGQGVLTDKFAFCQSLPLEEARRVTVILQKRNYALRSFRPYNAADGNIMVTARWEPGTSAESELQINLTLAQLRDQERDAWLEGYIPGDLTCYQAPAEDGQLQDRFAVVWRKTEAVGARYRLILQVSEDDMKNNYHRTLGPGFYLITAQQVRGPAGDSLFYGIATTDPKYQMGNVEWEVPASDLRRAATSGGPEFPLDLRPLVTQQPDLRLAWEGTLAADEAVLKADPTDLGAALQKGEALVHLGRNKEALVTLGSKPVDLANPGASVLYWRTLAEIRNGDLSQAQADLKLVSAAPGNLSASSVPYLKGLMAAATGAPMPPELEALATDNPTMGGIYDSACVYAWAAGLPRNSALERERLTMRALDLLGQAIAHGYAQAYHMWIDSDLNALRTRPEFVALVRSIPASARYTETYLPLPAAVKVDDLTTLQLGTAAEIQTAAEGHAVAGQVPAALVASDGGVAMALWTAAPPADFVQSAAGRIATYQQNLGQTLKEKLGYAKLSDSGKRWFDSFESANQRSLVNVLLQELDKRDATLQEYFLAYIYSYTDDTQGNLYYMDFQRSKGQYQNGLKALPPTGRYAAFQAWMAKNPLNDGHDPSAQSAEQIMTRYKLALEGLKPGDASPEAQAWWARLEAANAGQPALLLRLAEELTKRPPVANSIEALYLAACYSDTDDLLAQLQFLDYSELRWQDDQKNTPAGMFWTGARPPQIDLLARHVRARMAGEMPPSPPKVSGKITSSAELDGAIEAWAQAIAGFPGEPSEDQVYAVVTACVEVIKDGMAHNVAADLPSIGVRLSKADKYLIHEKDVTLFLLRNLPDSAALPAGQQATLEKIRDLVRDKYKDDLFNYIRDHMTLSGYADASFYGVHLQERAKRELDDLRTAYWLHDLREATELLESLKPDEKGLRAALADDVPVETLKAILNWRGETADELGRAGLYAANSDFVLVRVSHEQLRNAGLTGPIERLLKPDTEFYQVNWTDAHTVRLVYWDGSAWKMLPPLWEIPGLSR